MNEEKCKEYREFVGRRGSKEEKGRRKERADEKDKSWNSYYCISEHDQPRREEVACFLSIVV
jgi:hypothetical protein